MSADPVPYVPFRASDASSDDVQKIAERLSREPRWPSDRAYQGSSVDVGEHTARTRFHAHRAEYFSAMAARASSPDESAKFMRRAAISARHAETCARRAHRAAPGSVGATRARVLADKVKKHGGSR